MLHGTGPIAAESGPGKGPGRRAPRGPRAAGAAEPPGAAREWDEFEAAFHLSLRRKGGAPARVEGAGVHKIVPVRGWLPSLPRARGIGKVFHGVCGTLHKETLWAYCMPTAGPPVCTYPFSAASF